MVKWIECIKVKDYQGFSLIVDRLTNTAKTYGREKILTRHNTEDGVTDTHLTTRKRIRQKKNLRAGLSAGTSEWLCRSLHNLNLSSSHTGTETEAQGIKYVREVSN